MRPLHARFAKGLLMSVIVLLGVAVLVFRIARVIPGDPARIALVPNASDEQVGALRAELHLDAPVWQQFGCVLRDLSRCDLGTSPYTNRPVTADLAQYLPATLALAGIGQEARLTRANMVETFDKPYIEMAQAYGFSERRIAGRLEFRASLIPSLTIIDLDFASMLNNPLSAFGAFLI